MTSKQGVDLNSALHGDDDQQIMGRLELCVERDRSLPKMRLSSWPMLSLIIMSANLTADLSLLLLNNRDVDLQ